MTWDEGQRWRETTSIQILLFDMERHNSLLLLYLRQSGEKGTSGLGAEEHSVTPGENGVFGVLA